MTRWLHAIEPLIWPIFGAGFFAVAFVFPSFASHGIERVKAGFVTPFWSGVPSTSRFTTPRVATGSGFSVRKFGTW